MNKELHRYSTKRLLITIIVWTLLFFLANADIEKIIIIPYTNGSSEKESLYADRLNSLTEETLIENGGYEVINRSDIDRIINEQKMGVSGIINQEEATKIGQIAGAKKAVVGKIQAIFTKQKNEEYEAETLVEIKIIDIETARIYKTINLDEKGNGDIKEKSIIKSLDGVIEQFSIKMKTKVEAERYLNAKREIKEKEEQEKLKKKREEEDRINREKEVYEKSESQKKAEAEKNRIIYFGQMGLRIVDVFDYELFALGAGLEVGLRTDKIKLELEIEAGMEDKKLKNGDMKYIVIGGGTDMSYNLIRTYLGATRIDLYGGGGYKMLLIKDEKENQVNLSGFYGVVDLRCDLKIVMIDANIKVGFGKKMWLTSGISIGGEF